MGINAFYGSDLKRILEKYDENPALANRLDPKGYNIVNISMPHNDGPELRIFMFCKMIDSNDPVEAVVHMTYKDFNTYVQKLLDTDEVH
jgi:GrpB-like predicted nucleotidyltransferase (UPF0157 family)